MLVRLQQTPELGAGRDARLQVVQTQGRVACGEKQREVVEVGRSRRKGSGTRSQGTRSEQETGVSQFWDNTRVGQVRNVVHECTGIPRLVFKHTHARTHAHTHTRTHTHTENSSSSSLVDELV